MHRILAAAAIALAGAACGRAARPDDHTGDDGRPEGAVPIALAGGSGRAPADRVSYDDGDRVDWKLVALPAGARGRLAIELASAGAGVALEAYDGAFARIGGLSGDARRLEISPGADGRAYLQIFAPAPGDAASYEVAVGVIAPEANAADSIPDPPRLPAVPTPEPSPTGGDVADPDAPSPAVQSVRPLTARIVGVKVAPGGLLVTVDRGRAAGVHSGWSGQVLDAAGDPMPGGGFAIVRATAGEAIGTLPLALDQLGTSRAVRLSPP